MGNRSLSFLRQPVEIASLGFQKAFAYKTLNRVEHLHSLSRLVSARLKKRMQIQTVASQFAKNFENAARDGLQKVTLCTGGVPSPDADYSLGRQMIA
jgi:hypothetical protein